MTTVRQVKPDCAVEDNSEKGSAKEVGEPVVIEIRVKDMVEAEDSDKSNPNVRIVAPA